MAFYTTVALLTKEIKAQVTERANGYIREGSRTEIGERKKTCLEIQDIEEES